MAHMRGGGPHTIPAYNQQPLPLSCPRRTPKDSVYRSDRRPECCRAIRGTECQPNGGPQRRPYREAYDRSEHFPDSQSDCDDQAQCCGDGSSECGGHRGDRVPERHWRECKCRSRCLPCCVLNLALCCCHRIPAINLCGFGGFLCCSLCLAPKHCFDHLLSIDQLLLLDLSLPVHPARAHPLFQAVSQVRGRARSLLGSHQFGHRLIRVGSQQACLLCNLQCSLQCNLLCNLLCNLSYSLALGCHRFQAAIPLGFRVPHRLRSLLCGLAVSHPRSQVLCRARSPRLSPVPALLVSRPHSRLHSPQLIPVASRPWCHQCSLVHRPVRCLAVFPAGNQPPCLQINPR
jgi:hypothetical protein